MSDSAKRLVMGIILVLVTFGVYANGIGNGFVWDDHEIILNNPTNRDPAAIGKLFRSADVVLSTESNPYYRPLNRLTYMIDYQLFGLNPAGYHAESILVHCAAVLALFLLACQLFGSPFPAFAAALLFAVHPVNAEAVNFISGRNNLLATLFVLLSFLLWRRGGREGKRGWRYGAAALFLGGLLCKETALMLLPVLFLDGVTSLRDLRERLREKTVSLLPFFAATALYLVLRAHALSGAVGGSLKLGGFGARLLTDLFIIPRYALNILFPAKLSTGYGIPGTLSWAQWWLVPAWLILVAGVVLLVRSGRPVTRFALFWCAVNFIPIANIVPIPSAPMADRYLYLPALGVWLLVADQGWRLHERFRRGTVAGGLLVIVLLATATVLRNLDWRDDLSLFSSAARTEPANPRIHYNLGTALLERGDLAGAERELRAAIESPLDKANALGQLGYLAAMRNDLGEAERYFTAAVEANPSNAETQFNLALLLEKLGRPREALPHYEMFLRAAPDKFAPLIPRVRARVETLRGS